MLTTIGIQNLVDEREMLERFNLKRAQWKRLASPTLNDVTYTDNDKKRPSACPIRFQKVNKNLFTHCNPEALHPPNPRAVQGRSVNFKMLFIRCRDRAVKYLSAFCDLPLAPPYGFKLNK